MMVSVFNFCGCQFLLLHRNCMTKRLLLSVATLSWFKLKLKVSVFGVILVRISLHFRIRENTDQNKSEYGHFLRSVCDY